MTTGFISEMSAEPVHGGGITLHRVIGDGMQGFDWAAKTLHLCSKQEPAYEKRCRNHFYTWWNHETVLRRFLGCRLAFRLSQLPVIRRAFARQVARRLREAEPQLYNSKLLVCPQADTTLLVLHELQRERGLSYVTWMMDDHLVRWNGRSWGYPGEFEKRMQHHLVNAEIVYVISPAMQEFYASRFGVSSTVLCGPADLSGPSGIRQEVSKKPLRLAYFGSLGRWQNDAMALLASALSSGEIALDVYSHNPDDIPAVLQQSGARSCPAVAAEQVAEKSAKYHAVVLPISFKDELKNMSFFNIATKFSECLAMDVPTLLIGPPDAAMIKIATAAQACLVVSEPSDEELRRVLAELGDENVCQRIVRNAHELLQSEYSTSIMRERWKPAEQFLFGTT